jgi:hypothetical protein
MSLFSLILVSILLISITLSRPLKRLYLSNKYKGLKAKKKYSNK